MFTKQVRATDADKGLNGQLVYSLHAGAGAGAGRNEVYQLFGVHLASGTLYMQQSALTLGKSNQIKIFIQYSVQMRH